MVQDCPWHEIECMLKQAVRHDWTFKVGGDLQGDVFSLCAEVKRLHKRVGSGH